MDGTRLETASLIEKLPDYLDGKANDTQLGTQATGASSPDVTQAVTASGSLESSAHAANIDESRDLTPGVALCHTAQSNDVSEFESPSLRQFNFFKPISPQAAILVVGAKLNSANRFHCFFELHYQRFIRRMQVRTDFFRKSRFFS